MDGQGNVQVNNVNNNSTSTINVTIYNVDYTACVNKNILSVIIRATLKEGNSSQRVIIQTYNYNLSSGQEVEFVDLLQSKNIQVDSAEAQIQAAIEEQSKYAESLGDTRNSVYKRDTSDRMYTASRTENFFLDDEENLYAIYAYGNDNETTEFDIVEIK